jgi:hypothetical protein
MAARNPAGAAILDVLPLQRRVLATTYVSFALAVATSAARYDDFSRDVPFLASALRFSPMLRPLLWLDALTLLFNLSLTPIQPFKTVRFAVCDLISLCEDTIRRLLTFT